MYMPPPFVEDNPETLANHMREHSFASLITIRDSIPIASHLPLALDGDTDAPPEDGAWRLFGHMAKANDQWQDFALNQDTLAIFQGAHTYVSPNWYDTPDLAPTWNYMTVHAYGRPKVVEDPEKALTFMARLAGIYENDTTGNWALDDMDQEKLHLMMQSISVFEMPISRLEGKWKLSQNRTKKDAKGVIIALREQGDGDGIDVAEAMFGKFAKK